MSVVGLVVVVVLIGTFFSSAIWITSGRALTPLEQTLFQGILIILTFLFSWILAKRKEEENVLAKQKALAKSAARRIVGIARSVARLGDLLSKANREVSDKSGLYRMGRHPKALLLEKLSSFGTQLVELKDNVEGSIGDWRDILPEEFEKVEEIHRTSVEAQEDMRAELRKFREEIEQKGEKESKKREELDQKIVELAKKYDERIDRKWLELKPFGTSTITHTPFNVAAPSAIEHLATTLGRIGDIKIQFPKFDETLLGSLLKTKGETSLKKEGEKTKEEKKKPRDTKD